MIEDWLIAQPDDLCYSYFCVDYLYFTSQITKKYIIVLCLATGGVGFESNSQHGRLQLV